MIQTYLNSLEVRVLTRVSTVLRRGSDSCRFTSMGDGLTGGAMDRPFDIRLIDRLSKGHGRIKTKATAKSDTSARKL